MHILFPPKQIIFFQTGLQDKQDFLFPVNQQRLNPVKTYNYLQIRSGFEKALHQNYFLDFNNSSVPRFVIFAIMHSVLIWPFM
jgi:hypothetical protein